MTPSEEDRRKEARLAPGELECDIEGAKFAHVLGVTLGGHGMRVLTEKRLDAGRPLRVTLHLNDDEDLQFDGEVVWAEEKNFDFTQRFISGVRFVQADATACDRLHAFIERFMVDDAPQPGRNGVRKDA